MATTRRRASLRGITRCRLDGGYVTELELSYDNHPLEVIPFAQNGGDALSYGWVLLAPELDLADLPCVSFAPEWEGAVWLGDDTKGALETLLVGFAHGNDKVDRSQRDALCKALGLAPDYARKDISGGAFVSAPRQRGRRKRGRTLSPVVPAGYRFEATKDGIGVLAPSSAFAPNPFDARELVDEAATLAAARKFLARKKPASALVALKQGHFWEAPTQIVEMRREAYLALRRPALAARATSWLERKR